MKSRLYAAHAEASSFYRRQLVESPGGWAAGHLRSRGLGAVLASESDWQVGYAPDGWSRLVGHLRKAGFDDVEIVAAGLAFVTSNGYLVDRFRDRIMFVAHDVEVRPVGFIGRSDSNRLRYLNTRNTEIYTKARTLIGVDSQVERLRSGAVPVFVEGPMDAPAVGLAGERWAGLACGGTAITREQAVMARWNARTGKVVVALDGDLGGRTGAVRSLPVLSEVFDEVLFARLPDKQDPAALHAVGGGRLNEALGSAIPLADFAIEVELTKWGNVLDHLSGQVNAVRAVAPLVASLPAGRVAAAVARLARAVDLDEEVVSNEVVAAVDRGQRQGRQARNRRPAGGPVVAAEVEQLDCSRSP
ncbi:DNA primase [Kribbella aluminosa]|uniref:DNA primase n=1 Tax=Kribbella aluminosa TaxID=416017 RepID=A0ABS4UJ71_9ACTN|nr:toprim domain-containing protein [Kribbella aluminosa]MBP2351707.1 DNA primase [Kribbella aluminosa]